MVTSVDGSERRNHRTALCWPRRFIISVYYCQHSTLVFSGIAWTWWRASKLRSVESIQTRINMDGPPRYQPLSREDEDEIRAQLDEEKDGTAWNANDTEIIPTNTRSFVVYLSLLLLSFSGNILLVMDNAKLRIAHSHEKTAFSGLTFNTPKPYHAMTEFWSPNASETEMEVAWDAIDTGPMAVALHDDFVEKVSLPPTDRFPWDTERSVYYLKGIHDLHCLVCLAS
jgi:hypothetical protein